MPYPFICLLVGLAIFALALVITECYSSYQKWSRKRAADRLFRESDR